jgi:hypothetical protein
MGLPGKRMGLPGNLALAVGGVLVEGVISYVVMCSVRRAIKPQPREQRQPIRMTATVRRELPAPTRKELTS